MLDPVLFDGFVVDNGFGAASFPGSTDDWEAYSAVPDGQGGFLLYSNWALAPVVSPDPYEAPPLPYGEDLVLAQDSSLAGGETFVAGTVDLEAGVFTDSGTVDATTLTLGLASAMALLPGASVELSGGLVLDQLASLQVASLSDLETGSFNGSDAVTAQVTIDPNGLMNVGTGDGGSFVLSSMAGLTFADDGELNVGGQLTLQTTDGNVSFVGATLRMDDSPGSGGVNLIDDAGGTVSVLGSSVIVGAQAATSGAALQFGESGDGTVVNLGASSITGEGSLDNAATLEGSGSRIALTGTYLNEGAGSITEAYDGILSFQSGVQATTINPLSEGVFEIGSDGTLDLATNTSVGGATVNFLSNSGILAVADSVADFTGAVSGFTRGDELEIEGSTVSAATYDGAHTVQITESDGQTVDFTDLTIAGTSAGSLGVTNVDGDGFVSLCYLAGTRILTPTGEFRVEALTRGDRVVTRFGGLQRIKWIGRQSYRRIAVRDRREHLPVHLQAGSLGEGLPARDLYISPGHSMLVDDTLVLAKSLVNGITITQHECPERIDYFQIELERHDCVIAEGTWSETYADWEEGRQCFHNAAEFHSLFPEYRPPETPMLCAPRPERGAALDAVLRQIVARAARQVTPGALSGFIDQVRGEWKLEGWAHDASHPEMPVLLEILLEGRVIGTVLACDYREDLLKAGFGQGRCSFTFISPIKLRTALLATLEVRRAVDGKLVPVSKAILGSAREPSVEKPRLAIVA